MRLDDLEEWARNVVVDGVTKTENKIAIGTELYRDGWLRDQPVAGQHLNEILNIITTVLLSSAAPVGSPQLQYGVSPDTGFLECNGAAFNPATYPQLGTVYGSTLPILAAPSGFIYVVRGI